MVHHLVFDVLSEPLICLTHKCMVIPLKTGCKPIEFNEVGRGPGGLGHGEDFDVGFSFPYRVKRAKICFQLVTEQVPVGDPQRGESFE